LLLLVAGSCTEKKANENPEPGPKFAEGWTTWGLYTEATLTTAERALVSRAGPAGGAGETALGFTRDFDSDGRDESVAYGWFTRGEGSEQPSTGNFLLVTQGNASEQEVLLLQEFDNPPAVTVFTLKAEGSLYFGGGIDAGEVLWKLDWPEGQPRVTSLLEE